MSGIRALSQLGITGWITLLIVMQGVFLLEYIVLSRTFDTPRDIRSEMAVPSFAAAERAVVPKTPALEGEKLQENRNVVFAEKEMLDAVRLALEQGKHQAMVEAGLLYKDNEDTRQVVDRRTFGTPSRVMELFFSEDWRKAYKENSTFFVGGDRKDMVGAIRETLLDLGLKESNSSTEWDVFWGYTWESVQEFEKEYIGPDMVVNSFVGLRDLIGEKRSLAETHQSCIKRHGLQNCDMIAPAYLYPDQYKKFFRWVKEQTKKDKDPGLWICKPFEGYNGKNVYVIDPRKKSCPLNPEKWVVQQYISDIILWDGYKFDLRAWVVITSVNPLRIYFSPEAWPKTAVKKYDPDPSTFLDMCRHSTSPKAVGKHCLKLEEEMEQLPPPSTTWKIFEERLGYFGDPNPEEKLEWLASGKLRDEVQLAVMKALLMVYDKVSHLEDDLNRGGYRYRRVGSLSYDVLLTADKKAVIEEINTNGFYPGGKGGPYESAQRLLVAMMEMTGVTKFPRRPEYVNVFKKEAMKFCADSTVQDMLDHYSKVEKPRSPLMFDKCTEEDILVLIDFTDEIQHASPWRLAFPPPLPRKGRKPSSYMKETLAAADVFVGAIGRLDAIQLSWMRFINNYTPLNFAEASWAIQAEILS